MVSPLVGAGSRSWGVLGGFSGDCGLVLSAAMRAATEDGVRVSSGVAGDACSLQAEYVRG